MNEDLSRRDMLLAGAIVLGGGCLCHLNQAAEASRSTCCSTPEPEADSLTMSENQLTIELSKAPSLDSVGAAVRLSIPGRSLDILLVRKGKQEYVALDGQCTHAGRPLSYIRSRGVLQCNNFGHAIFDLDGSVIKGPAQKPLRVYPVTCHEGRLHVVLPNQGGS